MIDAGVSNAIPKQTAAFLTIIAPLAQPTVLSTRQARRVRVADPRFDGMGQDGVAPASLRRAR